MNSWRFKHVNYHTLREAQERGEETSPGEVFSLQGQQREAKGDEIVLAAKMSMATTIDWNAIITLTQKLEKHIRNLKSQSGIKKNVDLFESLKDYTADCLHQIHFEAVDDD